MKLGTSLPSTELQPADDLAVLAANVFLNLWQLSGNDKWLWNASALLEFGLAKSPQAWLMRLMLVRVYRLLGKARIVQPRLCAYFLASLLTGAPSLALDHYRGLRLKQIQNDTLSHFMLSRVSTFSLSSIGDLTMITEALEATQIHLSNTQEVSSIQCLLCAGSLG